MASTSSGLTMLTTGSSQYLHPDYFQPLPTTLDAKKSPLALLAQTCSAIGKDSSPPHKPLIPPLEKDSASKADSEPKRPGSHGSKESTSSRTDSKPGFRAFPPKEIPPLVPITAPASLEGKGQTKSEPKASPPAQESTSTSSSGARPVSTGSGQRSSSRSSSIGGKMDSSTDPHAVGIGSSHRTRDSPCSVPGSTSAGSLSGSCSPSYSTAHPTPYLHSPTPATGSSSINAPSKPPVSHPSSILPTMHSPAHLGGFQLSPHPLSLMGLDQANSAYHNALVAHSSLSSYTAAAAAAAQSSVLKAAAAAGTGAPSAGISPYVTYVRVRTPSGASTLVPVCRDPYCANCQLTMQNSHLAATCTAPGCAQCAHEKSLTSLSALGQLGASSAAAASSLLLPPFSSSSPLPSSMSALSSLHSLYPHSALVAAHQGVQPYVCNWVSGSEYCGKRFTSSEELLQHLRSHTSTVDPSLLAASYAGLGLPSALTAYPHLAPAPLSPNSLRRTYPTSLSPVSSLLGVNRYHPYKSPLSAVPTTAAAPQSYPPVGHYFPPYTTLLGQRLGAAVVP